MLQLSRFSQPWRVGPIHPINRKVEIMPGLVRVYRCLSFVCVCENYLKFRVASVNWTEEMNLINTPSSNRGVLLKVT